MDTTSIDLSVVVPVYNGEIFIGRSIGRLIEYVSSLDEPSELIIVDDGSVDRTAEIVHDAIDSFLADATEVDVDAVSDGKRVVIGGIMEHIEQAGVHSGDSACSIPPYSLTKTVVDEILAPARSRGGSAPSR